MMFEPGATERSFRLEDYLRAARERWYVVVGVALLVLLAASLIEAQRVDQYTARARVAVGPTPVGQINLNNLQRPNLERESEVMASNAIADQALAGLSIDIDRADLLSDLKVDFVEDSEVMRVSVTSRDPEQAATLANALADAYVTQRETQSIDFYDRQVTSLQAEADTLSTDLDAIVRDIESIDRERASIIRLADLGDNGTLAQLTGERELAVSERNATQVLQRQNTLDLQSAVRAQQSRSSAAEVLGDASAPSGPDGLGRGIILAASAIAGLMLGFAAAFLLQRLDNTAKTDSQVELALGAKVLGSVPRFGYFGFDGAKSLVMLSSAGSARMQSVREAYRRLATSVAFAGSSDGVKSILVTSHGPSEGKSTTVANLCLALAQAGKQVLVISADMRRPSLEERFGVALSPGLAECLGSQEDPTTVAVPGISNLWIISAGATPANPGELLGGGRFDALLEQAEQSVDFVVIDTPPVGATADATAAAQHADGVVVVVDSNRTTTADLLQVRADFERSGAQVLGSVRNRTQADGNFLRRSRNKYYSTS